MKGIETTSNFPANEYDGAALVKRSNKRKGIKRLKLLKEFARDKWCGRSSGD